MVFKIFVEKDISWMDEQLNFKLWKDKVPGTAKLLFIILILLLLLSIIVLLILLVCVFCYKLLMYKQTL